MSGEGSLPGSYTAAILLSPQMEEGSRELSQSESEVAQSCPTLCDPMECSLPGFSVHGISWAKILGWIAIPSSGGSSQPRDWTYIFLISPSLGGWFFTTSATWEAQLFSNSCQWDMKDTCIRICRKILTYFKKGIKTGKYSQPKYDTQN